jgi:hypothetical protein
VYVCVLRDGLVQLVKRFTLRLLFNMMGSVWEVLVIVNLDGVELLVKNRFVKVDVILGSLGSMSFWDRCQVDVILGSMSFWDRIGL